MGKIVAVGGGEMKLGETMEIDREIVRLTGKQYPRLLFLPTACGDAESYYHAVEHHFGNQLGCQTDVLYLIQDKPTLREIEKKILEADAVYVGGGNTARMMRVWRKTGTDAVLRHAYRKGVVLSGISAGAICWFRWGSSDSRKERNPEAGLIKVTGLDLVHATFCPHYDVEADRKPHMKALMLKTPGVAIAVDNCCAIEIRDDSYRVISTRPNAHAYRLVYTRKRCVEEQMEEAVMFKPLSHLL